MRDEEYLSLFNYRRNAVKIVFKPHPEDILDVDPAIIAKMKARLRGVDYSKVYDVSDRLVDQLALKREKNKLKRIFRGLNQLQDAFSSVDNISAVQDEMTFEDVDRQLLFNYSFMQSEGENVDEVDFFKFFLFGAKLITKNERICEYERQIKKDQIFEALLSGYVQAHFEPLKIEKEALQIDKGLQRLFKERKLILVFNDFLRQFYRVAV